jgi:hypothetical protein
MNGRSWSRVTFTYFMRRQDVHRLHLVRLNSWLVFLLACEWDKVSSGLQARPVRYQGGVGAFLGPAVSVEEIPRSGLEESAVVLHRSQHSQFRFRLL